ncbi:MAG: YhbY family RNA-binding protein [Cellvibrionales bacterium]|nr:YhbY family RNA-binding protein [Cellvibrionales bacterium]
MQLEPTKIKQFKGIGHKLNPIVIIGENGLTEGLINELQRALDDHELIKIKIASADRDDRKAILIEAEKALKFQTIQQIGKIALIYKAAKEPNQKLSNLHRPL